jgi:hypothetical protein
MVYDGSQMRLYKDGVQVGSLAKSGSIDTDSAVMVAIGRNGGSATSYFSGLIDDVRIYNRALSADENKRLYRIGATLKLNKPTYTDSLQTGLVGFWSFDGPDMAENIAYDRSGQGNNGTLTNGPVRTIGRIGQALEFDGIDDRVDTANFMSSGVTAFTLSAWVYKTRSKDARIVYKNNTGGTGHPVFGLASSGGDLIRCRLRISDGSGTDLLAGSIPLNTWTFVACVYDGSFVRNYANGVERGSIAETGTLAATDDVIVIGQNEVGTSVDRHWPGLIDEVRVYNRALTYDEIKRLYNSGR